MTRIEFSRINTFLNNLSRKSREKIEETFDLIFDLEDGPRLIWQNRRHLITKKENIYFIQSYWGYKTRRSKYKSERFKGGIDITNLSSKQLNDLKKEGWNTANLNETFKKIKNHPDYIQAKRKASIESLEC